MKWNIVVKLSKNILINLRKDIPVPVSQWGIGSSLFVSEFIVHSYCSTEDLHLVHLPRCKLEGFSNASLMGQDLSCQDLVGSYLILQFYNI